MNEKNLVKNIFLSKTRIRLKKIIIYEKNGNKNFGQKMTSQRIYVWIAWGSIYTQSTNSHGGYSYIKYE